MLIDGMDFQKLLKQHPNYLQDGQFMAEISQSTAGTRILIFVTTHATGS
jgi:hypothetical protein